MPTLRGGMNKKWYSYFVVTDDDSVSPPSSDADGAQPPGPQRVSDIVPEGPGTDVDAREAAATVDLAAGDLFFFFTDGISEAMDSDGADFGESRLSAFLAAHADLPPETIRDRLMTEVGAFVQGQPQHDDITMVILRVEELEVGSRGV